MSFTVSASSKELQMLYLLQAPDELPALHFTVCASSRWAPNIVIYNISSLWACQNPISEGSEGPKPTTATGITSAIPAHPVIVGTFQTPRGSEGPKARTVTAQGLRARPLNLCHLIRRSNTSTITKIATPIPTIPDTSQNPTSPL